MERISIDTAQNVTIDYQVANIGKRIFAVGIDILLQTAYFVTVFFAVMPLLFRLSGSFEYYIFTTLIFAPGFFYDFFWESMLDGQTLGKRVMNIRVVRLNGTRARISDYFLRWLIGFIEKFGCNFISLLIILINGRGQRLGDLAAGTTVVDEPRRISLDDTILVDTIEDYKVKYPQVEFLLESDISLIRDILERYQRGPRNAALQNIMQSASQKIQQRMRIQTSDDPHEFLLTVMRDYNHVEY